MIYAKKKPQKTLNIDFKVTGNIKHTCILDFECKSILCTDSTPCVSIVIKRVGNGETMSI